MKTLLLSILFVSMCVTASSQFGGGNGTESNPFKISSAEHLTELATNVNNGNIYGHKHFILTNDIDFSNYDGLGNNYFDSGHPGYNNGEGWVPIGHSQKTFWGIFNGQNKTINALFINRESDYQALFDNARFISNLKLANVNIIGGKYAAGLISRQNEGGNVTNCHVTGSIEGINNIGGIISILSINASITHSSFDGTISGTSSLGGIVGYSSEDSKIEWCRSNSVINGKNQYSGGIVGSNYKGSIQHAYSLGSINADDGYSGGICGYNTGGVISECFSTAFVSGLQYIAGIAGYSNNITSQCYFAGTLGQSSLRDGIVGQSIGTINNCFWDKTTTGLTSGNGTGLTTSEMKDRQNFINAGWDFNALWTTNDFFVDGYPHFMPITPIQPKGDGTSGSPYQIANMANLFWINHTLAHNKHYIQTANIEAKQTSEWHYGDGWIPIGSSANPFTGNYNGNGHNISNIHINFPVRDNLGLFGTLSDARIQKLGLYNIYVKGRNSIGALAAVSKNSNITYCFIAGNLYGNNNIGGFFNSTLLNNSISASICRVNIKGNSTIGGMVASALDNSTIGESYYAGIITGNSLLGGLISYADDPNSAGDALWDRALSGVTTSSAGLGYNTSEMKTLDTYTSLGWDGGEWFIDANINDGYPYLSSLTTSTKPVISRDLTIYPNPASTYFKIAGAENITRIEVYNNLGMCKISLNISQTNEAFINVSGLATGIYIVKVYYTNKDSSSHKLIINPR